MLKKRVITGVLLLLVLLPILFSKSFSAFVLVVAAFFAAAAWESFRLFNSKHPAIGAIIWTAAFGLLELNGRVSEVGLLFALCVAIWVVRLTPSLLTGLPALGGVGNRLLTG